MAVWWASLSIAMKVLWGLTLAASLIFIIQSVMTFIGADMDGTGLDGADLDTSGGLDAGADGGDGDLSSGSNLYTFRNLINFPSTFVLILISVLVGLGLVALVMYIFKLLSKMQQSGNIDVYRQAIGCQGTSYLTIPGERKGEGKVQISINNSVREYNAQTEGETIPTGTPIRVTDVINGSTLLVETIQPEVI